MPDSVESVVGMEQVGWWQPNVPETYSFHLKCAGMKYVVQDMDGLHPKDPMRPRLSSCPGELSD